MAIAVVILFVLLQSFHVAPREIRATTRQSIQAITKLTPPSWRKPESVILKVASVEGQDNELYEGALRSHEEQNILHGYEMRVLRKKVVDQYLSTPVYLLAILVEELAKADKDRTEWLLCVTGAHTSSNPSLTNLQVRWTRSDDLEPANTYGDLPPSAWVREYPLLRHTG